MKKTELLRKHKVEMLYFKSYYYQAKAYFLQAIHNEDIDYYDYWHYYNLALSYINFATKSYDRACEYKKKLDS